MWTEGTSNAQLCIRATILLLLMLMPHNRNSKSQRSNIACNLKQHSTAMHGCIHWNCSCLSGVSTATQHCSIQHITMHSLPFSMILSVDLYVSPCSTVQDGMPAILKHHTAHIETVALSQSNVTVVTEQCHCYSLVVAAYLRRYKPVFCESEQQAA